MPSVPANCFVDGKVDHLLCTAHARAVGQSQGIAGRRNVGGAPSLTLRRKGQEPDSFCSQNIEQLWSLCLSARITEGVRGDGTHETCTPRAMPHTPKTTRVHHLPSPLPGALSFRGSILLTPKLPSLPTNQRVTTAGSWGLLNLSQS